ncbi:toll/interleukin-1 receptor domain-containing protein [Actinosynnema sp. NPDC020468]|uniref:toll/interleukin-1 receptor domain-containing protein n=1 Tax=Actinosynnema sp. NPDC020468 TaxID=3154488 RepID=UPI0033D2D779
MTTTVFLNYRAADEPFGTALVDRELSRRFGSDAVFRAAKSIPLGADWERRMFEAVAESTALLVVMGRTWPGVDLDGRSLLEDPADFVRREILLAFDLGKIVVPVRLGRSRPLREELPDVLAALVECQDVEVRFRNAEADLDNLAERLAEVVPALPEPVPQVAPRTTITISDVSGSNVQAQETFTNTGTFTMGAIRNDWRGAR